MRRTYTLQIIVKQVIRVKMYISTTLFSLYMNATSRKTLAIAYNSQGVCEVSDHGSCSLGMVKLNRKLPKYQNITKIIVAKTEHIIDMNFRQFDSAAISIVKFLKMMKQYMMKRGFRIITTKKEINLKIIFLSVQNCQVKSLIISTVRMITVASKNEHIAILIIARILAF